MNWYYANAGQQVGPVSQEEFQNLAASGTIRADTLVWREGMSNWLPYSSVAGSTPPPSASPSPIFTPGGTVPANSPDPAYGASTDDDDGWEFAGFWIRFCGAFIDGIILNIIQFAIGFVFGLSGMVAQSSDPNQIAPGEVIVMLLSVVIGIAYAVFFLGSRFQATPGMMVCRIRIIVADGEDCSYLRALGRYFAAFLSALILGIGYLMCAWDREKRTLHDMICNTRVIKK